MKFRKSVHAFGMDRVKKQRKESETWLQVHLAKEKVRSDVSRLNIPQKSNVVTTPSGVRVILPSVRNDAHKSPSKANSAKSNKQVGISKSSAGKGSKSPMKKNSRMSHEKAKSPKRKDRTRVLDTQGNRGLMIETIIHMCEGGLEEAISWEEGCISAVMKRIEDSEDADLEFKITFLMLFIYEIDISKIDWRKYVLDCLRTSKDTWKGNDHGDTFYSGPITFLTLLYADITECKKFDVERRRRAISVWNMENLRRKEYLELSDGGFGTWKLIGDDGIQKEKPLDVFAERSEIPKISAKSKLKA
ncbi:hypothetical protein L6452_25746 [Arctium lappa]|uniref:Uncharacterized protein n=1 Tax=Arctium lappa TaxID=4217 RepID=A0ACB9AC67_ARCLA|nr:hypothetical protein L6452_25746 [Arctium lappa]